MKSKEGITISTFSVKPEELNSQAAVFHSSAAKIGNYSSEVHQIAGELDGALAMVKPSLLVLSGKLSISQKALGRHGDALTQIAKFYEGAENNILGGLRGESNGQGSRTRGNGEGDGKGGDGTSGAGAGTSGTENDSVFGEDNKYDYQMEDGNYLTFHLGDAERPSWVVDENYDNDFPYDPDAEPTLEDYANWAKWGALGWGADTLNYLPDGAEAYEHYREGNGEPLELDYTKAYNEDPAIKENCDRIVAETNRAVQQMIADGQQPPFSITSEFTGAYPYPETENWQKAIGGHQVWVSADVSYDANGNVVVETVIHAQDRYNFNRGQADIATGTLDEVNGRFEELGWAHSFDTYGEVSFRSEFDENGQIAAPELTSGNNGR